MRRTPLHLPSLKEIAYPAALIIYTLVALAAFISVARFLSTELNRAFAPDVSGAGFSIDRTNYAIVAQKLNLPSLDSAATEKPAPTGDALDKALLSIAVYNGTETTGLAEETKRQLEQDGFTVGTVGNAATQATTTVEIKESKRTYVPLLEASLGSISISILAEDALFDCVIIIGTDRAVAPTS